MDESPARHNLRDPHAPPVRGLWVLCAVVFAALYVATAQRGASWQDSGQDSGLHQWRVRVGSFRGQFGLATSHPLYVAAGQVIARVPVGTLEWRLNAFSGVGMAVALANLACVGAVLTGRRWTGLAVVAMLAVAHTVWWLATIAETYTWSAAGLTAELWLLVLLLRRPRARTLAALALVSGLGWSLHNLALLPLPVYVVAAVALVVRRRLPARALAAAAGAYLVGAGAYLVLIGQAAVESGSIRTAIGSALFGRYAGEATNLLALSKYWRANLALAALNFVNVLAPLAVIGWFGLRRRLGGPLAAAVAAITAIEILFVVRYPVPDQFTFLLPTLMMLGVAAAVGLAVVADASRRWPVAAIVTCVLSVAAPPVVYATAPHLVRAAGLYAGRSRQLPYRDELRYWLVPWKHNEDSAERFAADALAQAAPDGVIVADGTALRPLRVVQSRSGRPADVTVTRGTELMALFDRDRAAFRRRMGGRALLLVWPEAINVPQSLRDRATPPGEGEVLYRVKP